MNAKQVAERICAEWNGYSQNHSGSHYLVAQAYLDLERKYAAAMEVVEAVRECFFNPIVYGREAREEINRRDHRLVEALRKFDEMDSLNHSTPRKKK